VVVETDPIESFDPLAGRHVSSVRRLTDTPASRAAGLRRYEAVVDGWLLHVNVEPAQRARLRKRGTRAAQAAGTDAGISIRAQIPGRVVRVWVERGQSVETGQRLLAVEAMKMENEVRAPREGIVGRLPVDVGQTVELGDELVALE
jgi:biotin carboxyl carrier protein